MMLFIPLCLATAGALFVVFSASVFCFLRTAVLGKADRFAVSCLIGCSLLIAMVLFASAAFGEVPKKAAHYRALLTRTAHAEAGLSAPISTFAAQIQQESNWNPQAHNKSGAAGMAQFMPQTAEWMGDIDKRLSSADVYNPGWSMRALIVYDLWLFERIRADTHCDQWAMTLAAYNGGLGWVYRDQQLASSKGLDKLVWFNSVERVNAGRSAANFRQNRDYPRRILFQLEPQYVTAGWGLGVCKEGSDA